MIIKVTSYVGNYKVVKEVAHVFKISNFEIQGDRIPSSIGVAAGNLVVYNGTGWVVVSPPTLDNQRLIADLSLAGKVRWATAGGEADLNNALINGGFDFAQRQVPGTLTTITDNKYSADRWRVTRENADVQYQRQDALGESGLTSQYYGTWKKITNAGKLHICQIIEGANSVPLRGRTVVFQAKMKASAAKTIRMAIIELQNAGTIDTIPATLVTAFGADGTDPTLGSNLAIITGAESKSVTTSWQQFSVTVQIPSNSKNVICAIWSDADFAANDTLSMAEAGLYVASDVQDWKPRRMQQEIALCQRYYEKTFALDTAPAFAVAVPSGEYRFIAGKAGAVTQYGSTYSFKAMKRIGPTITIYNTVTGTNQVRDNTAGGDCSATSNFATEGNLVIAATGLAATAVGNLLTCHWTAEAEL